MKMHYYLFIMFYLLCFIVSYESMKSNEERSLEIRGWV